MAEVQYDLTKSLLIGFNLAPLDPIFTFYEDAKAVIEATAELDLVDDGYGDFVCPFNCGNEESHINVIHPSFPHEHANNCPITIARKLVNKNG